MTGFDLENVHKALLPRFDLESFDQFLLFKLNWNRPAFVSADGGLNKVIFQVLKIADMEGWDVLLVARAAEVRSNFPELQQLAKKYGQTLVGQYKSSAGNALIREAYQDFGLTPDGFQPQEAHGALEAIVDPENPMLDFAEWVSRAARVEGRVCRINFGDNARGTGFLVGPNAVLTNHHVMEPVITGAQELARVKLMFDHKKLKVGDRNNPTITILPGTPFSVNRVVECSPPTPGEKDGRPENEDPTTDTLDYALLEVKGNPGAEPIRVPGAAAEGPKRGWIRVPEHELDRTPFTPDRPVLIAQHPDGEPLQLAIDWNGMIRLNRSATRVQYKTNTRPGSSGSPCFDRNWNLIALHHYGDTKYVNDPRFNQAVPIDVIRRKIQANGNEGLLGGDCD